MHHLWKIFGGRSTLLLSIVLLAVTLSIAVEVSKGEERPAEPDIIEKLPFCGPDATFENADRYVMFALYYKNTKSIKVLRESLYCRLLKAKSRTSSCIITL